jgi:cyclohexanecarboxyl-CoA dehydrogenase
VRIARGPGGVPRFDSDDDQEALRTELRKFAAAELAPHYAADDKQARFRREVLGQLAAFGVLGLRIPELYGGGEADCVAAGIAIEEVSYADINSGYLILLGALVGEILTQAGDEEQRRRFLPRIAAGDDLPVLALTEPDHGSDAAHLRMKAEPDGDGWRLTGEKTSVTLGLYADTALIFARTGGDGARGVSAFYVDLDDAYLQRSGFDDLGGRAIGRASMIFDGHPAPATSLIGGVGEGFVRVMQGFDFSRALIALMTLGCAQASLDEAWQWCRDRHTMGKPIGAHQGVSFPLAECQTKVHAARLLAYEALWRKDAGLPHAEEAGMVKWYAPVVAAEAAHQALLTAGHVGYSSDLAHGQRLRDIIALEIADGTAQIAKLVVARRILGAEFAP